MNATTIARLVKTNDLSHKGRPGELVFSDCDPLPTGRNIAKSTAQKSKIAFAGAGNLLAGAEVTINVVLDCNDNLITLSNYSTAPKSLQTLLVAAINGDQVAGIPGVLPGFTATAVAASTTEVEIKGPSGKKFSISYSGFGVTINGVARPAVPTTTVVDAALCPGLLPYGFIVVKAAGQTSDYAAPEGLITGESDIASLPTGNINSEVIGFVVKEMAERFDPIAGIDNCCDKACPEEGINCGECYHILKLCCTEQQIWVPLEPFPAGTTVPSDLKGVELYYRNAVSGTNDKVGIPVLKLSTGADPSLKPVTNKAFHALVMELGGIYKGYQMARIEITPINN